MQERSKSAVARQQKFIKERPIYYCNCGLPATVRTSKTAKNYNKTFLCCYKGRDHKCRTFEWIADYLKAPIPKSAGKGTNAPCFIDTIKTLFF